MLAILRAGKDAVRLNPLLVGMKNDCKHSGK